MFDISLFTPDVQKAFTDTERGNTLVKCDDGGLVFLRTVAPNLHFFVEHIPDNYPSTATFFRTLTQEELMKTMQKHYGGWNIWKNNHDIPMNHFNEILFLDERLGFGVCPKCGTQYGECGEGFCEHDEKEEEK